MDKVTRKSCSECPRLGALVEEQKSKIQLLETRLKDVLRAYKVACKEKEELQTMSTSLNIDVDCKQHKRIAELEANVVHLSTLCGGFESERKQLRDDAARLETECETLRKELDNSNKASDSLAAVGANNISEPEATKTTKNKLCQTEFFPLQETIAKEIVTTKVKQIDQGSQTEMSYECAKNMVIVAPIRQHLPESVSEDDDDEYTYRADNRANANASLNSARRSPATATTTSANHESSNVDGDNSSNKGDGGAASLFYINELARKEIELADYRLRVREYECSLREVQWKYNSDKYRLQARIADLEKLNNTFIGRQPKETDQGTSSAVDHTRLTNINVAYIKNVLNKMLETKEKEKKEIMIKALITALNSMQTTS